MPTKPTFINTLANNAPAGAGALSLASIPAVYIGTRPIFAVNPVNINMKANLSQNVFKRAAFLRSVSNERPSSLAFCTDRLKNKMPIKTKVMLIAQVNRYFHVPSINTTSY